MLIYQEFLALNTNEEMAAFDPDERLRFAVHEIVIKLKVADDIKFKDLSARLKKEYKIDITEEMLKDIFTKWDRGTDPDFSIFKKEDKYWLDAWPFTNCLKKKAKRDKQSFGKHRKKEVTTYTSGRGWEGSYAAGYGSGWNWKKGDSTKKEIDDDQRHMYGWD
jgi:hypothetical protein